MADISDTPIQFIMYEPYVFTEESGTTKYIGTTISFTNGAAAVWKIKKEWKVGAITYMGFPDGSQEFKFVWNLRATYTYR